MDRELCSPHWEGGYRHSQGPPARSAFYHISYFYSCQFPTAYVTPCSSSGNRGISLLPLGVGSFSTIFPCEMQGVCYGR